MVEREQRLIADVIAVALAKDDEDDERWNAIRALQDRAGPEVFDAAAHLISSENAPARQLGVDILAQGQVTKKPMRDRAIPLLLDLAKREQNPSVIESICYAFGHLHDPATIDTARAWSNHQHEDVRFGVVHALTGYDDHHAIETLIQLSEDADSDVRDWATFALGSQCDVDTPDLRAALHARLDDSDTDTCLEALAGLARRCDPGIIAALRVLLAEMNTESLPLEAGLAVADPAFHPALITLARAWRHEAVLVNVVTTLEEAVASCQHI